MSFALYSLAPMLCFAVMKAPPLLFWKQCARIFTPLFVCVSTAKGISSRHHTVGSSFVIYSASFCIFIGVFVYLYVVCIKNDCHYHLNFIYLEVVLLDFSFQCPVCFVDFHSSIFWFIVAHCDSFFCCFSLSFVNISFMSIIRFTQIVYKYNNLFFIDNSLIPY